MSAAMFKYHTRITPDGLALDCCFLGEPAPIPTRFMLGNESEAENLAQALLDMAFMLNQRVNKAPPTPVSNPFCWVKTNRSFQITVLHKGGAVPLSDMRTEWPVSEALTAYHLGLTLLDLARDMRTHRAYVQSLKAG